ncbi:hypothetical protein [Marinobacter alexandrii]|uniref:hypothetical protein n=1 Tax=Marinobacter alexandrii TaxID=2570351 RepID=UPI0011096952|nr:hypothetical protein [Marinobacter alexandrii]
MIRFLGIQIERKTDILALAAFVISIGTLVTQGINLMQGPEVTMQTPRQVMFFEKTYPSGKNYLLVSAQMVYFNQGSPGYHDTMLKEQAEVFVGSRVVRLTGVEYVNTQVEQRTQQLVVKKLTDALPVTIEAGRHAAHETVFAPFPDQTTRDADHYVEFADFVDSLKGEATVKVVLRGETFSGERMQVECVLATREFAPHLKRKDWSAPSCHSN